MGFCVPSEATVVPEVLHVTQSNAMHTAGIREARQQLSQLLDMVRKGREVVITERGRPVARLAPVEPARGFPDLSAVRRSVAPLHPPLSQTVLDDRDDRS